jgi:chloramphenicol 3-O-phosphotransferase
MSAMHAPFGPAGQIIFLNGASSSGKTSITALHDR